VEGHRDLVVHGPLNLINMVNLWRDVQGRDVVPKKVTYRATSPLYAGERYRVIMDEEHTKVSQVSIFDSYGKISMVGQIENI
jgi:hydroxyacyl-ACP dehydratase HTD2-like protein with hotdog domain